MKRDKSGTGSQGHLIERKNPKKRKVYGIRTILAKRTRTRVSDL